MGSHASKLVLVCTILIFFTSCYKERETSYPPEYKLGDVELSKTERNFLPYQLGDTIIFKDSLGKSQLFAVESKLTFLPRYYKNEPASNLIEYYDVEVQQTLLTDGKGNSFGFELVPPLPANLTKNNINKNQFNISFRMQGASSNFFSSYIDTTDFYFDFNGVSIPFYPSITILNRTFNNVYELSNSLPGLIYYNINLGIVGYKTGDNTTWYLDI